MGKILGLVGAALLPPGLALTFLQQWAKTNPVPAIAAFIAYEALVGLAAFLWKIAGGAADELGNRWKKDLAESTDKALRRRFSGFEQQYRNAVLGGLRFIDLKGLATVGFYTPELDEVFVDVSLVFSAPDQVRGGVLGSTSTGPNRHLIGDLLDQPQPTVLAVVGAPGSGKTTLLRHTARAICRARRGRRRGIPVLLYLRDHAAVISADPEITVPDLVHRSFGKHGPIAPEGWFERKLRDGVCVVLLDGLDEVADQAIRRAVADWVENQVKRYPGNDYVITSRPHGYRTAMIGGATVVQVRSFTDEQVTRFVHGWYLAIEQRSTGASDADVRTRAATQADDLLERLGNNPALYELTVNPLLLTMIATVHRFRGALPGSRVDLYREICEVLLWRRQEAKNLQSHLTSDQKTALLSSLAFAMMNRRVRDLPRGAVIDEIRPLLRRMAKEVQAEDFLSDMGSNGLLLERESGLYSFAHLTFQEYLAAAHIREKRLVDVLAGAVDDTWWRETTLLYVARGDADKIVEACLTEDTANSLILAYDCSEVSGELAPELRTELDHLLQVDSSTDPARLALITRVLLQRHLSKVVRTAGGSRICTSPITTNLYELFLRDTGNPEPDGRPVRLQPRDTPVVGVRGTDAVRFAMWVNTITDSDLGYRLPTYAEIESSPLRRTLTDHCVWVKDGSVRSTPPMWRPHTISSEVLSQMIEHVDRTDGFTFLDLAPPVSGALPTEWGTSSSDFGGRSVDKVQLEFALPDTNQRLTREFHLPQGEELLTRSVGVALARALFRSRRKAITMPSLTRALRDELIKDRTTYTVNPDDLGTMLEYACSVQLTEWGTRVFDRFSSVALPVFERRAQLTAELAMDLRVAALRIAVEADSVIPGAGEVFRNLAAGVTLLQLRNERKAPVAETIVLAIG